MPATASLAMLVVAAALAGAPTAEIVLEPIQDGTLYEDPNGALANGAGPRIFAGRNSQGAIRRALVQFDVASAVPTGAVVERAELVLTIEMGSATEMTIHRVLAAWGEGDSIASGGGGGGAPAEPDDATWIHTFYDDAFWAVAGGDFAAAPSATAEIVPGPNAIAADDLLADVRAWAAGQAQHGWIVVGDESAISSARRIGSREGAAPPELRLVVAPACAGDADADGVVGLADLQLVLAGYAAPASLGTRGDVTYDGVVDAADLNLVLARWNAGCP